jgi:subtilisin
VSEPPPGAGDVFAELFHILTPERLLHDPRANGAGVRVCVLDSGVERAVLEEKFRRQGVEIHPVQGAVFTAARPEPLPYDGRQSSPHGTIVADVVLTLAPRVHLFSADVFGPQGSCEVEVVIRALRHAIDVWHCHVINLSLGVPEQRLQQLPRRQQLLRAVVVVVAAAHNDHPLTASYPAAFGPSLLSVNKRLFTDPLQAAYELRDRIEFTAHGRGYLGPFANEPATSWAAPHLTGIVARLLSLRPALKPFEIKTILYWMFRGN